MRFDYKFVLFVLSKTSPVIFQVLFELCWVEIGKNGIPKYISFEPRTSKLPVFDPSELSNRIDQRKCSLKVTFPEREFVGVPTKEKSKFFSCKIMIF
ncbi:hypothetical protein DLM78_23025 [Leptospira stimsonii]|uniref:Uncharacterized protein n=1 Tax=Leptospira stimsonii TaxID=2202203 RepID=A0A8B3CIP6_9LEPT|nr:hypothetical protein DLM78_23025 [Leptospira stimsonii]